MIFYYSIGHIFPKDVYSYLCRKLEKFEKIKKDVVYLDIYKYPNTKEDKKYLVFIESNDKEKIDEINEKLKEKGIKTAMSEIRENGITKYTIRCNFDLNKKYEKLDSNIHLVAIAIGLILGFLGTHFNINSSIIFLIGLIILSFYMFFFSNIQNKEIEKEYEKRIEEIYKVISNEKSSR